MSERTEGPLVWIDMEMTGLDPDTDEILEIATVITDSELKIIAIGPNLIVHLDRARFNKMDDWNKEHHSASGLWDAVVASKVTVGQAEAETLNFLKKYSTEKTSPLCGNSVWHDRRFLFRHMRRVDSFLHYRIIDVSSFKEAALRWYPSLVEFNGKKDKHRALEDILESIEELKYYRETILK